MVGAWYTHHGRSLVYTHLVYARVYTHPVYARVYTPGYTTHALLVLARCPVLHAGVLMRGERALGSVKGGIHG